MIKKSIVTKGGKVLNKESVNTNEDWNFPEGTRFMLNDKLWTVSEVKYQDNTEMRRIVSSGEDEILTLTTLLKDAQSASTGFKFVDPLPRAKKDS